VQAAQAKDVLDALWQREMPNKVYVPRFVPISATGGKRVQALTFLADTTHRLYVGELDVDGRAKLVAQGSGQRGRCVDYIRNTLEHMKELGVHDPHLARILAAALNLEPENKPE
jgi:cation transport protein ChaC